MADTVSDQANQRCSMLWFFITQAHFYAHNYGICIHNPAD